MKKIIFLFLFVYCSASGQIWHCDSTLMKWDAAPGEYLQKKESLRAIIAQIKARKELRCLCDAYRRLGILHNDNLIIDSAMVAFINSATLADSLKYYSSYASTCNQIAALYYDLGDDKQALINFQKAFNAYKSDTAKIRFRGMADAAYNMGWVYCERDELDKAEKLCLESIGYLNSYDKTIGIGSNCDLLADIYYRQKKFSLSKQYSRMAVDDIKKNVDTRRIVPALIQSGIIYMNAHKPDSAIADLKKAYAQASEDEYPRTITQVAKYLSDAYNQKNNKDSALHYLKIYTDYKDLLFKDLVLVTATEAATRYQTHQKDMQLLDQQKEISDREQTVFILVLLSAFLLFIIILLIRHYSHRKKIQKKEAELNNANAMLQGQDEERERIARELHDRVGSMLSTVKLHFSSMEEHIDELKKQQGKTYQKAIHLLDDTYEEVRRISHDLDTGLLSRFGFKTAMLQLIQLIEATDKMKVLYLDNNLEAELYKPFETDLYRITQELLSNTIKYASAKEISIQLSRNNGNLVYSYEDDGVGFEKNRIETSPGIGYKNIDSRVKKMNGKWHLDTSPGHGINLIIEIPLHEKNTGSNR